jgi:lysophospholipase L1-like esterase
MALIRARGGDSIARLGLVVVMAGALLSCGSASSAKRTDATSPLISRAVPAYASSELHPARNANDNDYGTFWTGAVPGWIAYDLSRVSPARRRRVIVGWFNDPITSPYDHTIVGEPAYDSLGDYAVQANAARTGSPPSGGWVTVATVKNNRYHSRQHLVDMSRYRWIRLNITAADSLPTESYAMLNLDVYDAGKGKPDSWLFLGDSITMEAMHHRPVDGVRNFSQLIAAARPKLYPAFEDGGIGFLHSSDGAQRIKGWLRTFPGRYVGLSYGTNDANACAPSAVFYRSYVTMVRAVLGAGKVPIVPTIPWARAANVQSCAPRLNTRIRALYKAYRRVVRGPDLWTYFKSHQDLIGPDGLHPSPKGLAAYRSLWATAMLRNIYGSHRPSR